MLRAPIILVLDARAMAQTAGAIVLGLTSAVPGSRIAGVILDRVAGEGHAAMCRAAIEDMAGVSVIGWLPRDPAIGVPERHLGLMQAEEQTVDFDSLVRFVMEHVDLDALLTSLTRLPPPEDAVLLYFGGGYPELHAEALAGNREMLAAVRSFRGKIFAECGGLMYLCDGMAGLIPAVAEMGSKLTLGYRELEAVADSPLAVKGQRLRGHELHYSTIRTSRPIDPAYRLADGRTEGFLTENVLTSYTTCIWEVIPASPNA